MIEAAPRPTLGARHVVALTVGMVVGAGIFRAPALVAGATGSEAGFLLAWVAGGLLSIVGALCYAELAAAFPHAGGDYHYLDRAFGPRVAFLHGWARLSVIQTGSLAVLAFLFADYLAPLLGGGRQATAWVAAAVVVGLTALNWVGVRAGAGTQLWLTVVEVTGLIAVAVAGLVFAPAAAPTPPPAGAVSPGLALVFVLLTFGGWSEAVYVSAELKNAQRRIAPVLIGSLVAVTALYLLVNLAYLRALGLGGIAGTPAVAAAVMDRAFGERGAAAISLFVALAALTSANATVITGARTGYALGRGFRGLGWLGRWDARRETPGNALIAQGAVALLLVAAGAAAPDGFRLAVEYTAPVFWLFLLLVGLAFFRLRATEPDAPRPFRAPLHPVLPALFCLTSAYLLWSSLAYTGASAWVGVAVLAVGGLLLLVVRPTADI